MHDLKWIRQNLDLFNKKLAQRGLYNISDKIIELDIKNREIITKLNNLQSRRNDIALSHNCNEGIMVKQQIQELKNKQNLIEDQLNKLLYTIPNLPMDDIPNKEPIEIRKWGKLPQFTFEAKSHFELFPKKMNFELAANMSGSRFVVLMSDLAKLERALGNFMLDMHIKFGFTEISPPLLVRSPTMHGTCQLPKFADDQFSTNDDLWLIPTAEVSLTNLYRNQILKETILPIRLVACTPCFRREAGTAGYDTQGMIRLHQFNKVELVSIATAEQSLKELEYITSCAEQVLQALELPYRIISLPANDIGFSSCKTYDIEVYLASQKSYKEISSCSYCSNIQSMRMKTRYKDSYNKNHYVHTLNGSGLAVGRTLVALLEYYQQQDGSVVIPEILQQYMSGQTYIKDI